MTIVIDTNVLIDATADINGYAQRVIAMVRDGKARAVASRRIEDEYRALMASAVGKQAQQELDEFFDCVERVHVHARVEVRAEDHDDQKFLDCAGAARADFIVTNDHHLLDLGVTGATRIVRPKEFITSYQSARDPDGKGEWSRWVKQLFDNT